MYEEAPFIHSFNHSFFLSFFGRSDISPTPSYKKKKKKKTKQKEKKKNFITMVAYIVKPLLVKAFTSKT